MRAEVNARRKRAPSEPETGSEVIKPEVWLETRVFHLLMQGFFLLSHLVRKSTVADFGLKLKSFNKHHRSAVLATWPLCPF